MPVQRAGLLDRTVERIHDVSSLPEVFVRVCEVVNDERSSVAELKEVVESDPSLASRVLRTVNSAAYGVSTSIDTLHQAICMLGFNEIRNLAITASVATIFKKDNSIGTYSRKGLWRHLVSVGLVSRMIALRSGSQRFDNAYLAGLIHDIGIILLDQHLHPSFVEIVEQVSADTPLLTIERENIGFTHSDLGARIAQKWRFSEAAVSAIRFHHDAHRYDGESQQIVQSVQVANFICTLKDIGSMGVRNVALPEPPVFSGVSIGRRELTVLWEDVDRELEKQRALLEI